MALDIAENVFRCPPSCRARHVRTSCRSRAVLYRRNWFPIGKIEESGAERCVAPRRPKCVRRQRNFSSARFNARRPRRRRPFRGININDPVQRAQRARSRISIIVRRCNGGRILKRQVFLHARELGVSGISSRRAAKYSRVYSII